MTDYRNIEVEKIVKAPISELWQEYSAQPFCEVSPLSVDSVPTQGIIFIGINPSLSSEDRDHLSSQPVKEIEFYSITPTQEPGHPYFKKFYEIANKSEVKLWGHLDLLYIRETQQDKVLSLIKTSEGLDFIYRQLMVTKKVIDRLLKSEEPIIFVVADTLARRFLGKQHDKGTNLDEWIGYDFQPNEDLGTYKLGKHHFFFTSILTGQRALDLGSYERLIWHIKFVKDKLKK
ncbi:MAG: hypothetical protein AAFX87_22800 [Bacteroidota bacterium]